MIGFIGAAPFAWRALSARWENGDLASGLLHFLITILGAAAIAGVVGMGIGSAVGWVWERRHRAHRPVRPDVDEAGRPIVDRANASGASRAVPDAASAPPPPAAAGTGPHAPKTLVIIFGPPAVGKMTVGAALARRTGLRLFHNHMTLELVLRFFDFGTPPFSRLVSEFRGRIFEEVAGSDLPGLIFTYVWAFSEPTDAQFVERVAGIFRARGAHVYYVELEAGLEERLRRNETEFRLAEKASKRDIAASRERLLDHDRRYRLNSRDEFADRPDYIRIDNTDLSAEDVADRIIQRFDLPRVATVESA